MQNLKGAYHEVLGGGGFSLTGRCRSTEGLELMMEIFLCHHCFCIGIMLETSGEAGDIFITKKLQQL